MSCFRATLVAAGLLLAVAAGPASAAPKKPVDPALPAVVDLGKVLVEYRKTSAFVKYAQKMNDRRKAFTAEMQLLAKLRYGTEEEWKEALAILAKPSPTEKEKARLQELEKASDALDNAVAQLSQKMNPTEEESKRLGELSQRRTAAIRNLTREDGDRRERLARLESELLAEVEVELLKYVERVARENRLPAIYSIRSVLFGAQDLTDEVVRKLPK